MRFDDDAILDASGVRDRRGSRIPGGRATVGGALAGVIVLLLALFLGVGPQRLGLSFGGDTATPAPSSLAQVQRSCRTGKDANARQDCRAVAVVNSVQDYWAGEFRQRHGTYSTSPAVFFSGRAGTGCGTATSAVGPFYCPGDRKVYLDLGFLDELRAKSGAGGGAFAQAYVIAHEYGHHVQDLQGLLGHAQDGPAGADGTLVRTELQADCYAGVWAHHARTAPDPSTGRPLLTGLTDAGILAGLDAAAAVGDDRIQQRFQGRAAPEIWTHGSARQRRQWFRQGYRTGDMWQCDTFR